MQELARNLRSMKGLDIQMQGMTIAGRRGFGSFSNTEILIRPKNAFLKKSKALHAQQLKTAETLIAKAFPRNGEDVQFHYEGNALRGITLNAQTNIHPQFGHLVKEKKRQAQIEDIQDLAHQLERLGIKKYRQGNFGRV